MLKVDIYVFYPLFLSGIVHADLKPANFVWVDDNLKIIDFGIASRLQSDLTSIAMANPKGTLNFISPEIIKLDDCGRSKVKINCQFTNKL